MREIAEAWRWGGSPIPDEGHRREAFNLMLSMPRSSAKVEDVQEAARAFAQHEFVDHAWVMVLHDHQANPHVHLSVRAESRTGLRLNPRKADLRRWREVFAERLRERGLEAEASSQRVRGERKRWPALWALKAGAEGRLRGRWSSTADGHQRPARDDPELNEAINELARALQSASAASDRAMGDRLAAWSRSAEHRLMRGAAPVQRVGPAPKRER